MNKKKENKANLGAPSEHLREQKIEDIQRIKNILNRRTEKDKKKNPYLKPDGSFDLIEKFPNYKRKRKRKAKR